MAWRLSSRRSENLARSRRDSEKRRANFTRPAIIYERGLSARFFRRIIASMAARVLLFNRLSVRRRPLGKNPGCPSAATAKPKPDAAPRRGALPHYRCLLLPIFGRVDACQPLSGNQREIPHRLCLCVLAHGPSPLNLLRSSLRCSRWHWLRSALRCGSPGSLTAARRRSTKPAGCVCRPTASRWLCVTRHRR